MQVIERRNTTSRYLCTKCFMLYWGRYTRPVCARVRAHTLMHALMERCRTRCPGSKKRIKEHLRDQAGDVKGCSVKITREEVYTHQ